MGNPDILKTIDKVSPVVAVEAVGLRWFTQDVAKSPTIKLVSPHQRNLIEDLVLEMLSCKAAEPVVDILGNLRPR
jgi:hypothetical protein